MSKLTKGYLIALVATTFWSTTGVFIRYLTETYHLPPLVLAFWRDLFVCARVDGGVCAGGSLALAC